MKSKLWRNSPGHHYKSMIDRYKRGGTVTSIIMEKKMTEYNTFLDMSTVKIDDSKGRDIPRGLIMHEEVGSFNEAKVVHAIIPGIGSPNATAPSALFDGDVLLYTDGTADIYNYDLKKFTPLSEEQTKLLRRA